MTWRRRTSHAYSCWNQIKFITLNAIKLLQSFDLMSGDVFMD